MHSFIEDASTTSWWLSVVVVGLIIHVIGTWLSKKMEDGTSRASIWWRTRIRIKTEERLAHVERLLVVPHREIMLGLRALRHLGMAIFFFVGAIFIQTPFFSTATHIKQIVTPLCFLQSIIALLSFWASLLNFGRLDDVVLARRKRAETDKPPTDPPSPPAADTLP